LTVISVQVVVDYMPISYVIYCHKRSFERMSLSYDTDLDEEYESHQKDDAIQETSVGLILPCVADDTLPFGND